eukprot:CAMPEP_0171096090 /NCGR_PEP_ID=MMETSP0766_2-20121228/43548_1 /TAXON_ID=439317 /ORGANISM="Gambierdiscus australes, Strain CAWD 149" /LENGTH=186 /DNA_ID=CAMNT_0011554997 /DNA_START=75 /DNA_END=635 /DNA_ORIENTATION=+
MTLRASGPARPAPSSVEAGDDLAKVAPEAQLIDWPRLEVEVDGSRGYDLPCHIADNIEDLMFQHLVDRNPLSRIKPQGLLQQVQRGLSSVLEALLNALALSWPETGKVLLRVLALQELDVGARWCSKDVEDHIQLIVILARVEHVISLVSLVWRQREARGAREEGATFIHPHAFKHAQQLCVDAAH